ncbi:acyltransferase domain-containing protein, partial [Micromonospora arborensis]|uniref:acyltransferase domain-containing protein n=1 Tax=Micromonospora arborensis TaxID=2116518 RepID=UPI0033E09E24
MVERVAGSEVAVGDVGLSLVVGRAVLEHRAVVVGGGRDGLLAGLEAVAGGRSAAGVVVGVARAGVRVGVMFPGQGSQWVGMGRGLYEGFPVFAGALDAVCVELDSLLERPLKEVLFAAPGSDAAGLLDQTVFTQAGLFAVEVALFRLLEAWGVRPDVLIGHSIGELTAAFVAGVWSLPDACALVAARGRLMQALPSGGVMVSVQASEDEVLAVLNGHGQRVSVAAVNGPTATVIAGDEQAVDEIAAHFVELGRKTRRLRVSHAFHSARIDPMLEEFRRVAAGVAYEVPVLPIVSNVTGQVASAEQVCDPEYWVGHARQPVRFADGVRSLVGQGVSVLLEVGPGGVLTAMSQESLPGQVDVVAVPTMRRDQPEPGSAVTALAALFVNGARVDWAALFAGSGAGRVELPTYAFQR